MWERLHLTTGLRLEVLDQHGDQTLYVDGQDPASWVGDLDNQEVLPRLAIAYDLTDKITSYASVSRGYLSGNFRYWGGSAQGSFQYDPEYSWNYEAGIKTSLWRDRLVLNGSLFYIDMRDKQVMEYSSELQGMELLNAAEAHSEGFELSLRAKPMEGLSFTAGFGYASAKIDDWLGAKYDSSTGGVVQIDYSGNYLSNAPRFTYNLGAEYRHRSGFMAGVDLLGTGEYYTDNENTMKTDGYQVVNLRVGYESERFDIVLWAKNLLDEEYLTMTYNWSGSHLGYEAPPRMIGLRLVWRY
jgi:iron complex outermembrane receptor protein